MTSSVEPLEHEITGNSSAKTLLIFLQGWPDSMEMWENYIQPGKNLSEFRILTMNFPNSGKEKISWGQDFDTISERIKKTVDLVEGVNKRILVCHDWGCVYGYLTDQVSRHVYCRNILSFSARSWPWMFQPMSKCHPSRPK